MAAAAAVTRIPAKSTAARFGANRVARAKKPVAAASGEYDRERDHSRMIYVAIAEKPADHKFRTPSPARQTLE